MSKLTEKQQLRKEIVENVDYDVNKAKQVYEFIAGDDTPKATTTFQPNGTVVCQSDVPKDGIYFVQPDYTKIHADVATDEQKKNSVAVGVRQGSKFSACALHDLCDGDEIRLVKENNDEFSGREHRSFVEAISDWDGQGNTEAMKNYLNPEILEELKDDEYIPSLPEQHLWMLFIKELNKALEEAGGEPLVGYHWSSSEYNSYYSWGVYFNNGGSNGGNKFNELTVRPAVACGA